MREVEWRQAARADLLSVVGYIADDNPAAARRLKDDIEAKVAKLPNHPLIYRAGRVAGTREMVVGSNYVVIYAAGESVVTILRVLHAAQQWPPDA
ncbi:MAG TPA: type II toxin-antitoxin system RelE/ParE family toxin [Rhodanobacteraceae bacterium]